MDNTSPDQFYSGVRNLLFNCGDCKSGQTLLIIHENTDETYFEPELALAVSNAAQELGLTTEFFEVGVVNDVSTPNPALSAKIQQADRTLYLARIGDQIRFHPSGAAGTQIVSYALDRDMLASSFGNADYRAFVAIKNLINQAMASAKDIHVTCPAGTDFKGGGVIFAKEGGDVTIKRFPLSVFAPVPAREFKGRIAQVGFLVGTGSRYYHPYACELTDTLFVDFEDNRITGFDGNPKDVAAAKAHYERVGKEFGIDPYFVHSWHAGIHPGCDYKLPAAEYFERWSSGAFGNPRMLHFHTCGQYPPGEISLNVVDPTIRLDGIAVWENGVLYPDRISGGADVLNTYPCAARAFGDPALSIGLGSNGALSFQT